MAKDQSDFIIFMVDGKIEITSNDQELSKHIRKLQKPYQLVVNKIDNQKEDLNNYRFYDLGWETLYLFQLNTVEILVNY